MNLLFRWEAELLAESGPEADMLDNQVGGVRNALHRTRREWNILKKALASPANRSHRKLQFWPSVRKRIYGEESARTSVW